MIRMTVRAVGAAAFFFTTPLAAQEALSDTTSPVRFEERSAPSGFVALGVGAVPAFEGAKSYQPIPFATADVRWQGIAFELRGLRARVDMFADSPLQFGPAINYRFKRDSAGDGKGRVRMLDDVHSAVEVGGFVGYRFGGNQRGQGEVALDLTVLKDVNGGHDGLIATAQASYAAYRGERLFVNLDAQTSVADRKYMRSYFGITPVESTRSGLTAYRLDGGIRDVGIGMTLGYQFSKRWGVIGRAGANYYLGAAADSPVVKEESRVQAIGGLALSYRF